METTDYVENQPRKIDKSTVNILCCVKLILLIYREEPVGTSPVPQQLRVAPLMAKKMQAIEPALDFD